MSRRTTSRLLAYAAQPLLEKLRHEKFLPRSSNGGEPNKAKKGCVEISPACLFSRFLRTFRLIIAVTTPETQPTCLDLPMQIDQSSPFLCVWFGTHFCHGSPSFLTRVRDATQSVGKGEPQGFNQEVMVLAGRHAWWIYENTYARALVSFAILRVIRRYSSSIFTCGR